MNAAAIESSAIAVIPNPEVTVHSPDPSAAMPPAIPSSGKAQHAAHAAPNPTATFQGFIIENTPSWLKAPHGKTSSHLRSKWLRAASAGDNGAMDLIKTLGLFAATALAEIVGCYLPYLWLKEGRSAWLLVPAAASLAAFAWLLTLHPTAAGRVYAAYGGVYVGVAILWLWAVDRVTPTPSDWIGVGICFVGMAVIMFGPRHAA